VEFKDILASLVRWLLA